LDDSLHIDYIRTDDGDKKEKNKKESVNSTKMNHQMW
jgi:hypothetical protein